jgi:hypothetical protein
VTYPAFPLHSFRQLRALRVGELLLDRVPEHSAFQAPGE